MLQPLKKRQSEGFTIIEVLIVLAIAGLILLIVFLAVPNLQRNARNTTVKNDASAVAAAISEYESNNNGAIPGGLALDSSGNVTVGTSGTKATAKINGSNTLTGSATIGTAPPASLAAGQMQVVKTACPGSQAGTRSVSVFYAIEQSGTTAVACVTAG